MAAEVKSRGAPTEKKKKKGFTSFHDQKRREAKPQQIKGVGATEHARRRSRSREERREETCYSVWMKNPEGIMNKNVTVLFKIVVTSTSQAKETEVMSEKR